MDTVQIKNIIINQGMPKICVPFVGKTIEEIEMELEDVHNHNIDIIEWRIDCFKDFNNENEVLAIVKKIQDKINEKILLVTFRTKKEGGTNIIDEKDYFHLYEMLINSGYVDMIDLEFSQDEKNLKKLIQFAHKKNVKVIVSYHNFQTSLSNDILKTKLIHMQDICADIVKVAVMPQNKNDVLNFMNDIYDAKNTCVKCPLVGIAMGELGEISRICSEYYGSAITFASMKNKSAPGQIQIDELFSLMVKLHEHIK